MVKDKIKEVLNEDKKSNKRKIENLILFIIVLIVTVIILNMILKDETSSNKDKNEIQNNKQLAFFTDDENTENNNLGNYDELEEKLAKILESISGVGKVNVLINYSSTNKVIAMYNENTKQSSTEETDTSGGVRTITQTDTQKDVVYSEENGSKQPVTETIIMPSIEGAIVTAKGASNASVKTNIVNAVVAVTGLSMDKVQVFEMGD